MRISVIVKANARENSLVRLSENEFTVRVKAPAKEGKANEAVIELLSGYFGIAKSRINMLKGHTSKKKIVGIA
ncbi:MAG: DUF167 domain-containing protein [Candidatus Omnitrophica bacterium]|nr:DUF167 domain-containing protein [Candidatus Omnitrophota bacterium]